MNEFSTDFVGTLADVNEEQLNHHGQGSYNTEDKDDESLYRSEQPRNAFNPFDPVKIQVQHQSEWTDDCMTLLTTSTTAEHHVS